MKKGRLKIIKSNKYTIFAYYLKEIQHIWPVSYTHLTLPTICSV